MIPPKVILEGDKDKAEELRAFALSQLRILHNLMSFRGLKQDVRVIRFASGAAVHVDSNHGLDTIVIYSPPVVRVEKVEVREELEITLRPKGATHTQLAGPVGIPDCEDYDIPEITLGNEELPAIGRNDWGWITVRGGFPSLFEDDPTRQYKYHWEIEGQGYYIDVLGMLTEETKESNKYKTHTTPLAFLGWCVNGPGLDSKFACEAAGLEWAYGGSKIRVWTDETVCGPALVTVTDDCGNEVQNVIPYGEQLAWASTNPTEIVGTPYTVLHIEHGEPPFTWTIVEGDNWGFSQDCKDKVKVTNFRGVDVYACVVLGCETGASFTVVDDCGTEVEGSFVVVGLPFRFKHPNAPDELGYLPCLGNAQVEIEGGVPPFTWEGLAPGVSFSPSDPDLIQLITDKRKVDLYQHDCVYCGGSTKVLVIDLCDMTTKYDPQITIGPVDGELDTSGSDETIDAGDTANVEALGGEGPYNWSVAGNGFTIPPVTEEGSNILTADVTACGPALVTVTDHCGRSSIISVRCTEGEWVLKSENCQIPGSGVFLAYYTGIQCKNGYENWCRLTYEYNLVEGYRWQQQFTCVERDTDIPPDCGSGFGNCIDPNWGSYPYNNGDNINSISGLYYYEWECPP